MTVQPKSVLLPELAEGELNAGIQFVDGKPSHFLILLPGDQDGADHATQLAWAASIGGDLPTPAEQCLLRANLPHRFKADWYWSNKTYGSAYAWCQDFNYGFQDSTRKGAALRAVAVRRLPIQLFVNSESTAAAESAAA